MAIIFFDGVCGLCNRFVDFVIARDKRRVFRYAPLQGEKARRELPAEAADVRSVILLDEKRLFDKSTAVLRVFWRLGGAYRLAAFCYVVPRPLRNVVYDWIAQHRYGWFGKSETCRLPTPEERALFFD
jgi:predicted DCC family thiol-disulfide oxidoreductase YuxK